jgi:two-component system sensor histidine kinase CreC
MKLGARIFICYLLIIIGSFYYAVDWVGDKITTRYLEGVEDALVDQANVLATLVGQQMERDQFSLEQLQALFEGVYSRSLRARIYEFDKSDVDINLYLTDAKGIVLFNARYPERVGADYSQWRDVYLTLKGEYGARSTRTDPDDDKSSVLHVAAPVWVKGELNGSLTVAKPMTNINLFVAGFKPQFVRTVLLSLFAALGLSLLASLWVTLPIKRLTHYARAVAAGGHPPFPKLDATEIGEMGRAFESMQVALEGKKYVEHYVQSLTHEIKSPLSAIRAAAELLDETMAPDQRARFLANIRDEAGRIQCIVEVVASKHPQCVVKGLALDYSMCEEREIQGDRFLLHEAVANLLQNAMDFSAQGGTIRLAAYVTDQKWGITLEDEGPGIPDYASDKIFNKFYSLPRPDTGKKSTGLGLNFVREVVALHHGKVWLANRAPCGVRVTLEMPCKL